MVWWIRPSSRKAGQVLTTAVPANEAAARIIPDLLVCMMKIPPADDFGGKSDIPEKLMQTDC